MLFSTKSSKSGMCFMPQHLLNGMRYRSSVPRSPVALAFVLDPQLVLTLPAGRGSSRFSCRDSHAEHQLPGVRGVQYRSLSGFRLEWRRPMPSLHTAEGSSLVVGSSLSSEV